MHCIIGLGNPGKRYLLTRHNVGFLFLDYLSQKLKIPFSAGKGDYYFCQSTILDKKVILIKPTTFMNNSGLIIDQVDFINHDNLEELLVVYDDFHLPFGTVRFRPKGSDAGHNGVKSLIYYLQSDIFPRVRLGIGDEFDNSIDHVLSRFEEKELEKLPDIFDFAYKGIKTWISSGIDNTMNNYNRNVLNLLG